MTKILIDIGNTNSKVAIYKSGEYSVVFRESKLAVEDIKKVEQQCVCDGDRLSGEEMQIKSSTEQLCGSEGGGVEKCGIDYVALSAVGEVDVELLDYLRNRYKERFLEFSFKTPIPIKNLYKTPETLGSDRLLAAIGANEIYKEHNVLVVDLGSAITIDFVNSAAEYLGGNISTGVQLRFKSLSESTKMLPLCKIVQKNSLSANSTKEAIELGVINGITYELEGYISRYEKIYNDLKIIFTGGDAKYFAETIKNTIFVDSELVFVGLNKVADYNVERD